MLRSISCQHIHLIFYFMLAILLTACGGGGGSGGSSGSSYSLSATLADNDIAPGDSTKITITASTAPGKTVTITPAETDSDDLFSFSGNASDDTGCTIAATETECVITVTASSAVTTTTEGSISLTPDDGSSLPDQTITVDITSYTLSDSINATEISAGGTATITITASNKPSTAVTITPSASASNLLTFSGDTGETSCTIGTSQTSCTIDATAADTISSTQSVTISLTSSDGSSLDDLPLTITTNTYSLTAAIDSNLISAGDSTNITVTATGTLTSSITIAPSESASDSEALFTFSYPDDNSACSLSSNNMSCTITVTAIDDITDTETGTIILTPSDESTLPDLDVTVLIALDYIINATLAQSSINPKGVTELTFSTAGVLTDAVTITAFESNNDATKLFNFGASNTNTDESSISCSIDADSNSCSVYVQAKSTITTGSSGEISFQTSDGQTIDDLTLIVYILTDDINANEIGADSQVEITITASSAVSEDINITLSASGDTQEILTFSGDYDTTGCTIKAYTTDCVITVSSGSTINTSEDVTIDLTSSDGSTLDPLTLKVANSSYTLTADITEQIVTLGGSTAITVTASGTLTNAIIITPTDSNKVFTYTYTNADSSSDTNCTLASSNMSCTITATAPDSLSDTSTTTISLSASDKTSLPSFEISILNRLNITLSASLTDTSIAPDYVTSLTVSTPVTSSSDIKVTTEQNAAFTFGISSGSADSDTATCTISAGDTSCGDTIFVKAKDTTAQTGSISFIVDDSSYTLDDISLTIYTISGQLASDALSPGDTTNLTLTATSLPSQNVTIEVEESDGNSLLTFAQNGSTEYDTQADCGITTSQSTCTVSVKVNDDITQNYNDVTISLTPSEPSIYPVNIDDVSLSISSQTGIAITPSMSAMTLIASEIVTVNVTADSNLTAQTIIEISNNDADALTLSSDTCTIEQNANTCNASITATATGTSPNTSINSSLSFTITDTDSIVDTDNYLTRSSLNYTIASQSAFNLTPTITPANMASDGTATITLFANTILTEDVSTTVTDNSGLLTLQTSPCTISAGDRSCSITASPTSSNTGSSSQTGSLSFTVSGTLDATYSPQLIDYSIFPESYSVSLTPSITVNGEATEDYSFITGDSVEITISADSAVSSETTIVASDYNSDRQTNGYFNFLHSNQCSIPIGETSCSIEALINYVYSVNHYDSIQLPTLSLSINNPFASYSDKSVVYEKTYNVAYTDNTIFNAWITPNPLESGEKGMLFVKNNLDIGDTVNITITDSGEGNYILFGSERSSGAVACTEQSNSAQSCICTITEKTQSCGIPISAQSTTGTGELSFSVTDYTIDSIDYEVATDTYSGLVRGWPKYLAMGAITDLDDTITLPNLVDSPVNTIYKYVGTGKVDDNGQTDETYSVTFPIYTYETIEQTFQLNTSYSDNISLPNNSPNVLPTMVAYTVNASYTNNYDPKTDLQMTNSSFIMMNYFTKLIMVAQMLERSGGGSLILNPDLMGWLQQSSDNVTDLTDQLNNNTYTVQQALIGAVTYAISYHTFEYCYTDTTFTGYQYFTALLDNPTTCLLSDQEHYGVYNTVFGPNGNDSQFYEGWNLAAQNNPPDVEDNSGALNYNLKTDDNTDGVSFDNTLSDWIQATHWIIETFAPNVSYGWMENLWATGNANTVIHTDSANVSDYAEQVYEFINGDDIGAYNGTYIPDFIVFDRYESDDYVNDVYNAGWAYNARDWYNYIEYVGDIAENLGVPAVIWQIPGAHIQSTNDIDTRGSDGETNVGHGGSAPNFLFSESQGGTLAINFDNLIAYLGETSLDSSTYNLSSNTEASEYLKTQPDGTTGTTYLWHEGYLSTVAEKNIMAILWGGGGGTTGATTNVAPLYNWSSLKPVSPQDNQDNDSGWLATRIRSYFANPETLSSNDSAD
ncbi:hypothetical protein [uncultured Shewanella sp.]|uniref:beta strand repeat-containing protein n=1 Tax=uncultured Shewanella sp. TaxID=173975 RepID=UPI00262E6EAF|nr:hypothetical protein [uncultured Shewanella sp.]